MNISSPALKTCVKRPEVLGGSGWSRGSAFSPRWKRFLKVDQEHFGSEIVEQLRIGAGSESEPEPPVIKKDLRIWNLVLVETWKEKRPVRCWMQKSWWGLSFSCSASDQPGPHTNNHKLCACVCLCVWVSSWLLRLAQGVEGGRDKAAFHIPRLYLNIAAPACVLLSADRTLCSSCVSHFIIATADQWCRFPNFTFCPSLKLWKLNTCRDDLYCQKLWIGSPQAKWSVNVLPDPARISFFISSKTGNGCSDLLKHGQT